MCVCVNETEERFPWSAACGKPPVLRKHLRDEAKDIVFNKMKLKEYACLHWRQGDYVGTKNSKFVDNATLAAHVTVNFLKRVQAGSLKDPLPPSVGSLIRSFVRLIKRLQLRCTRGLHSHRQSWCERYVTYVRRTTPFFSFLRLQVEESLQVLQAVGARV